MLHQTAELYVSVQQGVGSSRALLEFESGGELMATRLGRCRQWQSAERQSYPDCAF